MNKLNNSPTFIKKTLSLENANKVNNNLTN